MTDTKLLPLPEYFRRDLSHMTWEGLDATTIDYARANMAPLIAEIERLRAEREVIGAEAVKYAGKSGRLEAKVDRLEAALRDIESRPWNGVRPIQIAARAALLDQVDGD